MRVTSSDPVPMSMSMRPLRTVLCSSVKCSRNGLHGLVSPSRGWAPNQWHARSRLGWQGWVGGVMTQDAP